MTPRVTGLTVTYGSRADLVKATVEAALVAGVQEVVVVSNGADPEPLSQALEGAPAGRIRLVETGENLGSAGGFAVGLRAAVSGDAELIWILDDDNVPRADALERLLDHRARSGSRAHVAYRPSDTPQSRVARGWRAAHAYGPPGSFLYFDVVSRLQRALQRHREDERPIHAPVEIPYAPYGGLLIDSNLVASLPGPRTAMWLYEDDSEWTARIAAESPLLLCLDAVIDDIDGKWSENGAATSGPSRLLSASDRRRRAYAVRNRIAFDLTRATSVAQHVRFLLNAAVYLSILCATAVVHNQIQEVVQILRAMSTGRMSGSLVQSADES